MATDRPAPGGALPDSALNLYDPTAGVEYHVGCGFGGSHTTACMRRRYADDTRDVRALPLPPVPPA